MGIFHPQKSIRTEIEKSSTYNCLFCLGFSDHCVSFLFVLVVVVEIAAERRRSKNCSSSTYIYQLTLNPAPGWKNARGAWDSQLIFRHNVCSAALEPQLLNFSCFSAFHQGSSIQCVWKKEFSTFSIFSSLFFGKCWNILLCFLWRNKEKYQWFYFWKDSTFHVASLEMRTMDRLFRVVADTAENFKNNLPDLCEDFVTLLHSLLEIKKGL